MSLTGQTLRSNRPFRQKLQLADEVDLFIPQKEGLLG
jgi:hypothetical protein